MKKIIIALFGLAVAGSSFAAATQVCSGTGGNGTLIAGNAANFVRIDVLPKCSNNVLLKYDQTANGFAAAGPDFRMAAATGTRNNNIFNALHHPSRDRTWHGACVYRTGPAATGRGNRSNDP